MRSLMLRRRRALASILSICLTGLITASSQAQPAASRPPRLAEPVPPVSPISAGVAVLIVDPPSGVNAMDSDALLQRRINTHAATIASEQHLRKVIAQAEGETRKTRWFKESDNPLERAEWLRDHLHVSVLSGTSLIQVSLPDLRDPAERKAIVQAICQAYLEGQPQPQQQELLDRTTALNDIRIKTEARLKELRAEMRSVLGLRGVDDFDGQTRAMRKVELAKLVEEQVEAHLKADQSMASHKMVLATLEQGKTSPDMEALVRKIAPNLQKDQAKLRQIEDERNRLASQDGAENVKLKAIVQQAETMRVAFDKELNEAQMNARTTIIESAAEAAKAAAYKFQSLTERAENLRQDMAEMSKSRMQYETLKQEESRLVQQIMQVRDQLDVARVPQSGTSTSEIRWQLYPEVTPVR
jgi:hypothetical protein